MAIRPTICSVTAALTIAVAGWTFSLGAGDAPSVVNPTGTWKVTFTPKSPSAFEPTLKLKREGDKLAGTLSQIERGQTNEVKLEDAKLKGAQVSFATHQATHFHQNAVAQPADKSPVVASRFQGRISGDTIKGKVEKDFMGNVRSLEWEAKRMKP